MRRGTRRPEARLPGALPGARHAQRRLPSRAPRRSRMAGRCAARWREGHRGDVGEGLLTARGTASPRRRLPAVGLSVAAGRKNSDFLDCIVYAQTSVESEARGRVPTGLEAGPLWTEEAMGAMRLAAKRRFVRGGGSLSHGVSRPCPRLWPPSF